MSREADIQTEMGRLQMELDGLPLIDRLGVREAARQLNMSPTTIGRIKNGGTGKMNMAIMSRVLPYLSTCPLCKQRLQLRNRHTLKELSE